MAISTGSECGDALPAWPPETGCSQGERPVLPGGPPSTSVTEALLRPWGAGTPRGQRPATPQLWPCAGNLFPGQSRPQGRVTCYQVWTYSSVPGQRRWTPGDSGNSSQHEGKHRAEPLVLDGIIHCKGARVCCSGTVTPGPCASVTQTKPQHVGWRPAGSPRPSRETRGISIGLGWEVCPDTPPAC